MAGAIPPPVGWPVRVARGAHAGHTGTIVSGLTVAAGRREVRVHLDGADCVVQVALADLAGSAEGSPR